MYSTVAPAASRGYTVVSTLTSSRTQPASTPFVLVLVQGVVSTWYDHEKGTIRARDD